MKFQCKPGTKFGRWTVIEEGPQRVWFSPSERCQRRYPRVWAKCECGTIKLVQFRKLQRGESKSCGCLNHDIRRQQRDERAKKRVGKTFRGMYVKQLLERQTKTGYAQYLCICSHCGKEKIFNANQLRLHGCTGCGCQRYSPAAKKKCSITTAKRLKEYGYKIGRNEQYILDVTEDVVGKKIVRQYQVGAYTVDGYIPELNLVFEVDEAHHKRESVKEYDKKREQRVKEMLGCHIVRIRDPF